MECEACGQQIGPGFEHGSLSDLDGHGVCPSCRTWAMRYGKGFAEFVKRPAARRFDTLEGLMSRKALKSYDIPRGLNGERPIGHNGRPYYSEVEKVAAVELAERIGMRPAARQLGIPTPTMYTWARYMGAKLRTQGVKA